MNEYHMDIDHVRLTVYRKLRRIMREMDVYRDSFARRFGISGAALYLLVSLDSRPNCSYKDLAAETGVAPNTVSSVVQSLIGHGLVSATPDSKDRRIIRLDLTASGQKVVEQTWVLLKCSHEEKHVKHTEWVFTEIEQVQDFIKTSSSQSK